MTVGVYKRFRLWQTKTENGRLLFQNEKDFTASLMEKQKPSLVVQLEGRSLLSHYPKQSVYYHVSEEANSASCAYTVEAEQGFMPFPDRSVDLLLVSHALELYQAHKPTIAELERVLADGGRVVLFVMIRRLFEEGVSPLFQPLGKLDILPLSIRRIKDLLHSEGLEVLEMHSLTGDLSFSFNERLSEYFIAPVAMEVVRSELSWNGTVGALNE